MFLEHIDQCLNVGLPVYQIKKVKNGSPPQSFWWVAPPIVGILLKYFVYFAISKETKSENLTFSHLNYENFTWYGSNDQFCPSSVKEYVPMNWVEI